MHTELENPQAVQFNLQNRIRSFLLEYKGMQQTVEALTVEMHGDTTYCFPYPAIDWDTVRIDGVSGSFRKVMSRENNWHPCIEFMKPQNGIISISSHQRYLNLILARIEDVPEDISSYFESLPGAIIVPIAVPIIYMEHSNVNKHGRLLEFTGSGAVAVYGPPDDQGMKTTEYLGDEIGWANIENESRMKDHGIQRIEMSNISTNRFDSMCEFSIEFSYEISVNTREERYWQTDYQI